MWVFLTDAFVSIVEDRNDSSKLRVRARIKGDIERLFGVEAKELPSADYRFHVSIPREEVVKVIGERVLAIDYPDFKSTVKDRKRHDAYMSVWSDMHDVQQP